MIGAFLLKNWMTILPYVIIIGLLIFYTMQINSKDNTIQYYQNELAKQIGITQVAESLYETMALNVSNIQLNNDTLSLRLEKTNRELISLSEINLMYKTSIDSIKTMPGVKDTVYIGGIPVEVDEEDRVFSHNHDSLYISGFYNTTDPFLLFITEIKLLSKIEVAISEGKHGALFVDVDTHSKWISPKNIKVQFNPLPRPWEYFYGVDIVSNTINILAPKGVGIHGGVKKGGYSGRLDIRTISSFGTYVGVGFTKYVEF